MVKIEQPMPVAPKPPCAKDCPNRAAACAVNCKAWNEYVAKRAEYYAEKLRISKANARTEARVRNVDAIPSRKKKYPGRL